MTSVEDALRVFCRPEELHDFKSGNATVSDASKVTCILRAPRVLLLHLKRFTFNHAAGAPSRATALAARR